MKIFRWIIFVFLVTVSATAQPREGKTKELSLSASYQYFSSGSSSTGSGSFLLSPRLGFYVYKGVEFEPELLLMVSSGNDHPLTLLDLNVCFNILSQTKNVPFVLLGYGFSNTVPYFNVPLSWYDFTVDVFNIGGGMKIYFQENVAVRIEYRYQKFSGQGSTRYYGDYTHTPKVDTKLQTL